MPLLTFIFSHDDIFRGVKQESSLLAERQKDQNGISLFDDLVFDEEYLIKFRELFFDAQAEIITVCSAYMKYIPVDADYFETQDFREDRDFEFQLLMPESFLGHMYKPIDSKIKQYLIAYVMYRWLETKVPQLAGVYFDRSSNLLPELKSLLEKRNRMVRIRRSPL